MAQYFVRTQKNKAYRTNEADYIALVSRGCLVLFKNTERNVHILSDELVLHQGTYLEFLSQDPDFAGLSLSFLTENGLEAFYMEQQNYRISLPYVLLRDR